MSNLAVGFTGLGVLVFFIALRMHIGIALGIVSVVGIAIMRSPKAAGSAVASLPFEFAAHWSLSAIPMFLLMGAIAFHTGMTANLFQAARKWLSFLPGGLAVATCFASAGFAAASGSSMATAAAMGRLAIPEMLKAKYDPGLSAGVVAASGTLGSLIPPSILMVLYGIFTQTPISKLLIAGIGPGLLTAAMFAGMIMIRVKLKPSLAPALNETITWNERFTELVKVWPIPVLVCAVVVSLYAGIATATEAASIGAAAALVIAAVQRKLTWDRFRASIIEALSSTGAIFFIAVGAILFTRFLAFSGIPVYLADLIGTYALSPVLTMILISLVYVFLGMFLDPLGLMLVTLPVFLPMFQVLGLDLIWTGVIVIKFLEIGLLTPPVGLNAYVVASIVGDKVPLMVIFKGLMWFLFAELIIMILLFRYPAISLYLPSLMN
ncbi:MAG: TRAP transporter large permease subunit [Marinosulfonomonas sp.]|nr:TRAP transporter large permease subunit [Marinosulfonomonas sp.]